MHKLRHVNWDTVRTGVYSSVQTSFCQVACLSSTDPARHPIVARKVGSHFGPLLGASQAIGLRFRLAACSQFRAGLFLSLMKQLISDPLSSVTSAPRGGFQNYESICVLILMMFPSLRRRSSYCGCPLSDHGTSTRPVHWGLASFYCNRDSGYQASLPLAPIASSCCLARVEPFIVDSAGPYAACM